MDGRRRFRFRAGLVQDSAYSPPRGVTSSREQPPAKPGAFLFFCEGDRLTGGPTESPLGIAQTVMLNSFSASIAGRILRNQGAQLIHEIFRKPHSAIFEEFGQDEYRLFVATQFDSAI